MGLWKIIVSMHVHRPAFSTQGGLHAVPNTTSKAVLGHRCSLILGVIEEGQVTP